MAKKTVQAVIAYSLAAAMAVPAAPMLSGALAVHAAEDGGTEVEVPEPIVSYDFESGLKGVSKGDEKFEITKSKEVYVQKTEQEVSGTSDKVDANGLVYTGSSAKYHKTIVSNQPTSAYDEEKGTVLKMGNAVKLPAIKKEKSANLKGDTAGTEALDKAMPVSDGVVQEETNIYSQLKISNPFAGLADQLQEYDELFDLTKENGGLVRYGDRYMPLWKKGVTISYWIKVPVNEDGTYKPSSALRWELDNQNYYQADDYGKYLTCKKYDLEQQGYTEEQKASFNESGVPKESDFYFEYDKDNEYEGWYTDADGVTGPIYKSKMGKYASSNKNFKVGFEMGSDGNPKKLWHNAYYPGYHKLPTEISKEEYDKLSEQERKDRNIRLQEFTYALEGIERYMEIGDSKVRFANIDGEFQIDVDNSAFWVPDNVKGIQENPNLDTSYGVGDGKSGMHNADVFFMNSWQEAPVENKTGGPYQKATYVAESPVTKVVKDKDGKVIESEKNASANTWQHVTITLQNDWVEFYMNGEKVDVQQNYSSRGGATLDKGKSFKRLNKGGGLRYGYGSEKPNIGNIWYGNYVCRLFMDWLSDKDAVLCIGGTGEYAIDYNQSDEACEFSIDDLTFYDKLLEPEQIKKAYEQSAAKMKQDVDLASKTAKLDLTKYTATPDGICSPVTDTIKGQNVSVLKVNENKRIGDNQQVKLDNPFAGKKLQGATIAYWMKQDARTGLGKDAPAQATIGVTFMDAVKHINNPKEPDQSGEGSSVISMKTDGTAQFMEGYTGSVGKKVKNTFTVSPTEDQAKAFKEAASSWHYYTMTMTNAGIKLYVDGVEIQNSVKNPYGARFLDGYFTRVSDEKDITTKYGAFGGTNNQGATTLMDILTYNDTSLYLGYLPQDSGSEKTNPAYYGEVKTFDTALDAEQVKELYEKHSVDESSNPVVLGDVNGDTSIDLTDANVVLKGALKIVNLEGNAKIAADVNKDGSVDLTDANLVLKRALKIIGEF